jgi:hypothetical protein
MTWTIDQFSVAYPTSIWEAFFDRTFVYSVLVAILVLALSYLVMYQLLLRHAEPFRSLTPDQQVVTVHHAIEAILLSLLFAPFTYLVLHMNFEVPVSLDSERKHFIAVAVFMCTIMVMYMIELAARLRSPRGLVIFHHVVAYSNGLFLTIVTSSANVKACSLLVYFIVYESVIFMGLVMYRLYPFHPATPKLLKWGMGIFAFSRPIQFIWIIASLAAMWNEIVVWQAVVQIMFTVVFTSVQVYSLTIHATIIRKVLKAIADEKRRGSKSVANLKVDLFLEALDQSTLLNDEENGLDAKKSVSSSIFRFSARSRSRQLEHQNAMSTTSKNDSENAQV